MEEKRHSKRMDLEVKIKLKMIEEKQKEIKEYEVKVRNISRGGMAFACKENLEIGSFYDVHITIWTKERIDAVIRVARKDEDIYGAEFVGLNAKDQFRIQVYELFNYADQN